MKFLNSQVLGQSRFTREERSDAILLHATFFSDFKEFERTVSVWLFSKKDDWEKNRDNNKWLYNAGTPINAVFNKKDGEINDGIAKGISYAIRNSATLTKDMAFRISNAWIFPDKGAIGAYFHKISDTAQFDRILGSGLITKT